MDRPRAGFLGSVRSSHLRDEGVVCRVQVVHDVVYDVSRLVLAELCASVEAIRMLEEGVATAEDIDAAMELGYKHPVGPLRTTDIVGLDVRLGIAEELHAKLGDRFSPPELLRRLVADGHLGRKTGRGFYEWIH